MNLSSLSNSLRLRLESFAGRLRTTGQPAAATAAAQPAPPGNFQGVSDRVTLGASQEAPTLYDKQGMLSGGSDATAMRKQATDKVAELKKRMKWLKAMMTGASPAQAKGLARQLALVAGELKQAVKQFAGNSGGQAASAPQASAGAPSAANASADASAQAAAPLQAEGQAMAAAALSGDAASQSSAGSAERTPAFAGHAATSSTGSAAEADAKSRQDFIQDAKAVASDIKRALEALKRKLRQSGQDAVRQTEKLLHEVGKMLNALGQQSTPAAAVSGSLANSSAAGVSTAAVAGVTTEAAAGSVDVGSATPTVSAAG